MPIDYDSLELPLIFPEDIVKTERKKPVLSDNSLTVLKARYLRKNIAGEITETAEEMFHRVASAVAGAEVRYGHKKRIQEYEDKFYALMASLDFLPNSPTLMNAGLDEGQLSACFVIPVGDSMPEIFEAVKHAALIQKSGGGVGYSFSKLRPAGDRVKTTSGVSSGPISFMRVFNEATETVKQGGRRRGANMGVLRVDHPDILDFINAKKTEGDFFNFNISVGLTNVFMKAVREGTDYALINPRSGKEIGSLDARKVWKNIVGNAWENGDPGLLFLDRINQDNPTPRLGFIESTNPCGEACLLPFEACNLGSINVSRFVVNGTIDYSRMRDVIKLAVRFLDDVIDVNDYVPLIPQIKRQARGNRKIGLGIMGFADLLLDMAIPYNDDRALKVADALMSFINKNAREASRELARERGCFPNWEKSVFFPDVPIRNASLTSIAPTGTLSIISGCSPGIEPLFGVSFERNVLDNKKLLEVNPRFERIARERGFYSEELMKKLASTGTIQNFPEIPEDVKKLFVTAFDIPPERHVLMQAAFQNHTDMSVSKTINLLHEATAEDVEKVYVLAHEMGCKGITVFRYGSRRTQVIVLGDSTTRENGQTPETEETEQAEKTQVVAGKKTGAKGKKTKELAATTSKEISKAKAKSGGNGETSAGVENVIPTFANEIPCPECGEGTIVLGACSVCQHCGYSKCG